MFTLEYEFSWSEFRDPWSLLIYIVPNKVPRAVSFIVTYVTRCEIMSLTHHVTHTSWDTFMNFMSHTCNILSKTSTINLFNIFFRLFKVFSILLYFLTVSQNHSLAGKRPADFYSLIIDNFRHHSIQSHVLFEINLCSVTGSGFGHQVS